MTDHDGPDDGQGRQLSLDDLALDEHARRVKAELRRALDQRPWASDLADADDDQDDQEDQEDQEDQQP
jgi:hypothetical protein